ncbi:tail tube [Pectobacterium bacteriophage PM2]|uniref:Baseplate tail tube initiator n=1 Tax=Pectobacterium bacteriophage PM2 TaxID=1429794 RepID=A0A0A0Q0V1_9CAUD|nr:tail tube [Pectobacterium bacteriophage PM2]AHY25178.1 baseplate tail tube initiator [Pectobacterium bacteriophage PM2]
MFTLQEFENQAVNIDFQRNNLFSVVFATTPSSKSQALLDQFGGAIFDNLPFNTDFFGITRNEITQGVTALVTAGTQKLIRKSGVSKYLIGAMSNRVVQSLLGEFEVGTFLLDFFNMAFPTAGLLVHTVKLPDNVLNYEMDLNHNAPNIKLTGREYSPLVLSFRVDSEAANYRAFNDWVNSVQDPVSGLRALPEDVEADIQVNLHARNGLPHTVVMMQGCVPVGVSAPELSYEGDNQIATFDVTFAYRVVSTGAVGRTAALDWLEDKAINVITGINGNQSLSTQLASLSRLSGAQSGMSNLVTNGLGAFSGWGSRTSSTNLF